MRVPSKSMPGSVAKRCNSEIFTKLNFPTLSGKRTWICLNFGRTYQAAEYRRETKINPAPAVS
ncbi:hypothetical protein, partial [Frankia sp. Cj3]|uniref:hypothetical protein n=1 Tax=Frankia sp. Cj3 TaxID=2880976 RepID=UPI001EF5EB3C